MDSVVTIDQLNINDFTQPFTSQTPTGEICTAFPYPIGPVYLSIFRNHGQHSLIQGAVTSIAPSSVAPRVPLSEHSGHLVSVNGGEIKILGPKKVTYITDKVVMNVVLLIVEDVVKPSIGQDTLHQKEWSSVSSVSEWEGISSAAWSKSSTPLPQESLLFIRVGHSRFSQRFASGMGGSQAHCLRLTINKSDHCRD